MSQQVPSPPAFSTLAHAVNPSYQVLISGTVRDELTGLPPMGELLVSVDSAANEQLVPKTLDNGLFCFAGESRRLFPQLATQGVSIVLSIAVAGYKPYLYTLAIAPGSSFPLRALDIELQRVPVRIQGYVVEATPTLSKPVRHARVRCTAASSSIGSTSTIVTLRTPLHDDHPSGTPVQCCQLLPEGSSGQLVVGSLADSLLLVLSKNMQVVTGDALLIGTEETGDYGIVAYYERASDQTLVVQLTSELYSSFAAGTAVQRCAPAVSTMQTTLARTAMRGDGILYLTDMLPFASGESSWDALKLAETDAARVEYHALDALSDDNGYYRLDGMAGAMSVFMEAQAVETVLHGEPIKWMIDYGQPTNNVDFRLLRS